jgi:protease-4
MGRGVLLSLLVLSLAGCCHPIRTEDILAVEGPVHLHVKAEVEAKETSPVVEMPVDGCPCAPGRPRVAIIDVDGLLLNQNLTGPYSSGDNPVDLLREKLNRAAGDPCVCAVVLRINSPGGGVTASDIMWREVKAFRARTGRPVVACLMDLGCAGGYFLATAADRIVAHPTTVTGGIGVVLNLYDLQDALGTFNIRTQFIKAGPNIDMGSVVRTLPAQERQALQKMANQLYDRFRGVVAGQRPQVADETSLDGRVFLAPEALQRGLIDHIGYIEDAIAAAGELSGRPNAGAVILHRVKDVARTPYAVTANVPLQATFLPVSIPGVERNRWPTFLYLWQPDPTLERLSGR